MPAFTVQSQTQVEDKMLRRDTLYFISMHLLGYIMMEKRLPDDELLSKILEKFRVLNNDEIDDFLQQTWEWKEASLNDKTFLELAELKNIKNIVEAAIKAVKDERQLPARDKFQKINEIKLSRDSNPDEYQKNIRMQHIRILLNTLSDQERAQYFNEATWKFSKDGKSVEPRDEMTSKQLALYKGKKEMLALPKAGFPTDGPVVSSQSSAQQAPVTPAEPVVSPQARATPIEPIVSTAAQQASQAPVQQVPVTTADGSVASPQALKAGKRDWLKLTLITAASILGIIGCTYLLGRLMAPKQTEAAVKTVCNAMSSNIPNFALKALEKVKSVAKPLLDKVSVSRNSIITRG
ncbi:hypothetical protein [Rickettsiales endosymbiont of Stachyamoeba lipophora]|uniref:hypothetical protein n=1 Tax=Rickettsiales endosymbiont of Stachyamoeba lipophora TaxID=2486578 RepID=UPI000F655EFF|nr:hypothetical protein [Rickettsiales endosymbiont of Stachyamoeba lipophora]AZL14975.1 hypothetical protein EF513_00110 [Rickettsiales endosymbiont of Stachyamoeba lipophora]